MSEVIALPLVLLAVIAGLIKDCREHLRLRASSEYVEYSEHRSSDSVMMFAPFLVFFYTDNFWPVAVGLVAILLAGMAAQSILWRKNYLRSGAEMMLATLPGLAMIILLIYWLVVLDGVAIWDLFDQTEQGVEAAKPIIEQPKSAWLVWWPYAAYGVIILANLLNKNPKQTGLLGVAAIGFLVLPFFTEYFWICLGLGVVGFFWLLLRQAKHWGTAAGAGSAFFFMYMLAAGGAAMVRLGLRFFGVV
ncbi:hypothetical protein [Salinibius halmophilus]|uniref:hypothetical protein n=1 Tax=Salinibius halmophilus TaxID=1853216 RepID=UPI000E66211F|nr:hypothetical protein [Salinibius halmophilus]